MKISVRGRPEIASRFHHWLLNAVHRRALGTLADVCRGEKVSLSPAMTLGLAKSKVSVALYDEAWSEIYRREAEALKKVLGEHLRTIHHIGSTSIPGLGAKPIIDLTLALDTSRFDLELKTCAEMLSTLGYGYSGNRGKRGGHYFEKGSNQVSTFAIQVHPESSPELARLLRFRDLLIGNPLLFSEYKTVKAVLASYLPNNRRAYLWYKGHWVNGLLLESDDPFAWSRLQLEHGPITVFGVVAKILKKRLGMAKTDSGSARA